MEDLREPKWSDADHQIDMRCDPLTTGERINSELAELRSKKEERDKEKSDRIEKERTDKIEMELRAKIEAEKEPVND